MWSAKTLQLPFKEIVLVFMWAIYGWEQYLSYRQLAKLQDKSLGVPASLKAHVSTDENEKARAYGIDKAYFKFVQEAFVQLQGMIMIVYDLLPAMWVLSKDILVAVGLDGDREAMQSVVFVIIYMLISTLLSTPFSVYSTFVIEQKHGFNKQTPLLFLTDMIKEIVLSIAIGSPLVAALVQIIRWGGQNFVYYVWVFLFCFQIIMVMIYPTFIQPLFNNFKPLDDGDLKTKINQLAASIKFPLGKIFVVDGSKRSSHSNAYFYGFFKNKRIVLYDTLLEQSSQDEILGVLAHELGHWKLNHIYKMLAIGQVQTFVIFYLFSLFIHSQPLYRAFGCAEEPVIIGLILFSFLYHPVEALQSFLVNALSRMHEFQADNFAVKLGHSAALASGLIKLNIKNLGNLNPDKLFSMWHYSHPPLVERLAAITDGNKKKD